MNSTGNDAAGLLAGLVAVIRRDVLLAWKRPGDVLNPLFFFAMVSTLFPLAVGPSPAQLQFSGPGVVWVAALLATLLSLNTLFLSDFEDGSLDQLLLSPQPLPLLALGKAVAHWLITGLPLVLVSPLIAITFHEVIEILIMSIDMPVDIHVDEAGQLEKAGIDSAQCPWIHSRNRMDKIVLEPVIRAFFG